MYYYILSYIFLPAFSTEEKSLVSELTQRINNSTKNDNNNIKHAFIKKQFFLELIYNKQTRGISSAQHYNISCGIELCQKALMVIKMGYKFFELNIFSIIFDYFNTYLNSYIPYRFPNELIVLRRLIALSYRDWWSLAVYTSTCFDVNPNKITIYHRTCCFHM